MKKRFTEEQIIGFLREADAGMAIKDLCRRHGFSEASYYLWRSKFGGMTVSDAKRLKELEAENTRLKKLLAAWKGYTKKRSCRCGAASARRWPSGSGSRCCGRRQPTRCGRWISCSIALAKDGYSSA